MLPIENYIDAIENKDYEGLGTNFSAASIPFWNRRC